MTDSESDVPHVHPSMSFPCQSECLEGLAASKSKEGDILWNDEKSAIEHVVTLKQGLRSDTLMFWDRLTEHLTLIGKAQYAFVTRRVHGGPMAELNGRKPSAFCAAFYWNDGYQNVGLLRNRYFSGGNPLLHMDHERPCLIPGNLTSVMSFGDDKLPFPADAYLAIPLISDGKCLAYLGLMWSPEGNRNRTLSWSFLELILHSLDDVVVNHLLQDNAFTEPQISPLTVNTSATQSLPNSPIDDELGFTAHMLKPYARSLSHELRTPMQGVVGMLDIMHATVRKAAESKKPIKSEKVFKLLKDGIEMIQDSARRAIEAADNIVHAYDLNMQVPKTPQREKGPGFPEDLFPAIESTETRPNIFIEGNNIAVNHYRKRRRSLPHDRAPSPPRKQRVRASTTRQDIRLELSPRSEEVKNAVHESDKIVHATPAQAVMAAGMEDQPASISSRRSAPRMLLEGISLNSMKGAALRCTKLRDLLRLVINESLHVGGRPESAISNATELGEMIEVRTRSSNGDIVTKIVDWSVDPALPDSLLVDDRDLAKLISCVFLNAIKFTNNGTITVCATVDAKSNDILILVRDTGPGIPPAFFPNLFKPFAREDMSTTRSKDGLGLGLLVAKGLSRKMGGDLICVRSCTTGPDHGSDFQIRVPVNQRDTLNNPGTPNERLVTPPMFGSHSRHGSASSFNWEPSLLVSPIITQNNQVQEPSPSTTGGKLSKSPTPPRVLQQFQPNQLPISRDADDKRKLGEKYPLRFLVAEDNRINRRVLVNMLRKLGYRDVLEAADGQEAVQIVQEIITSSASTCRPSTSPQKAPAMKPVDVVLMDLWMPIMDGYEATTRILQMIDEHHGKIPGSAGAFPQIDTRSPGRKASSTNSDTAHPKPPTVLAVSADVTDEALHRASKVGIKGYMTKPYKLMDLERLIVEFCGQTLC